MRTRLEGIAICVCLGSSLAGQQRGCCYRCYPSVENHAVRRCSKLKSKYKKPGFGCATFAFASRMGLVMSRVVDGCRCTMGRKTLNAATLVMHTRDLIRFADAVQRVRVKYGSTGGED